MQHISPNSKRWDHSDIPGGGHKIIKGPAHMVEGGHHHRKSPTPHPHPPPGPDSSNKKQLANTKFENNIYFRSTNATTVHCTNTHIFKQYTISHRKLNNSITSTHRCHKSFNLKNSVTLMSEHFFHIVYYTEAKRTWPPFFRWHFQMHFVEWKCSNSEQNIIEIYSWGFIWLKIRQHWFR